VKDAVVQDESAKSANAVVPVEDVVPLVRVLPPAVYAEPVVFVVSFVEEYTVVEASSVAEDVYRAILNVSAARTGEEADAEIACTPLISCSLNEVHMKLPVNAITAS
jgi:Na+(H+)/acetate symporter ActP